MLPVVRKAQIEIASDESLNHEYINVTGKKRFMWTCFLLLSLVNHVTMKATRLY